MRRHLKKSRSTRNVRRVSVTAVVVALTMLVLGAATVLSRQNLSAKSTKAKTQSLSNSPNQQLHTSNLGQFPQDDPEKLVDGLKQVINQSTEGLSEVHHADGSVSLNLEDRFQNVTVAKDANGRLSQSCVDNPQAAGAFFNIDPKLIDNKPSAPRAPVTNQ